MTQIFISYRREDDPYAARHINAALRERFGKKNVYFDIEANKAGLDFRTQIDEMVSKCDVMLVVIGDRWFQTNEGGRSRLEDTGDFINIEVSSALKRDIPVIPVLVGKASMPTEETLPSAIKALSFRHAVEVRAGSNFDAQINSLVQNIEAVAPSKRPHSRVWVYAFSFTALLAVVGLFAWSLIKERIWDDQDHEIKPTSSDSGETIDLQSGEKITLEPGEKISCEPKERHFTVGQVFRDCDEFPEMVVIPGGSFLMGSPLDEEHRQDDEGLDDYLVNVESFAIGKYEITVGQFKRFVEAEDDRYQTDAEKGRGCFLGKVGGKADWYLDKNYEDPGWLQTYDMPATCLSWNDAMAYVNWLSKNSGKKYRLPSEAELEYVIRAGTSSLYPWGEDKFGGCQLANVGDQSGGPYIKEHHVGFDPFDCNDNHANTSPVGSFAANVFGLHDTSGNVWEWVADCYQEDYTGAPTDGSAWLTNGDCSKRVLRGGSWSSGPPGLRAANRQPSGAANPNDDTGFRVARDLD